MTHFDIARRAVVGGIAGTAALGVASVRAATPPPLPRSPVRLNVIDVAGQLQLTQGAIQSFIHANPKLISNATFTQAPAPELPGKLKAMQAAGRVDLDLVMTGTDGLSAGIDLNLWVPLVTDYAAQLPDLNSIYLPGALKMQGLAANQAVCVVFCPAGPIIEYMPEPVKVPPKTAQELLDWAKAHPKRFIYARPANSGPGRTFLQGLPYILHDKDPMDPKNGWDKTWAYLIEIGKYIEYYPSGTTDTFKELANGTRDIIASHVGWDVNTRILGVVPKEVQAGTLEGFHWVTDAQYWAVPKGVPPDHLAVVLEMTKYMLSKPAQAMTYDKGYFYPGPAVKDVPLSMAPPDEQKLITEYTRPFYTKLFEEVPSEVPLPADKLVYAFNRWDQQVGSRPGK